MAKLFYLFGIFLYCISSSAGLVCDNVFKDVPLRDSSVEIEINGSILDQMFTTADGTIGPVIKPFGESAIPSSLLAQIKSTYPGVPVELTPWDLLSKNEKEDLILNVAKLKGQDFFKDRTVQGLVYRENIDLIFNQTAQFIGKSYSPGKYQFKSKDLFGQTAIEFSGPNGMQKKLAFEIHFRRADGADKNLHSVFSLQQSLVGRRESVHQHVVAPVPLENLAQDPELVSLQLVDLYRRVSLHAQMLRISKGQPIEELAASTNGVSYINMPLLGKRDLRSLHMYFLNIGDYGRAQKKKALEDELRRGGSLATKLSLKLADLLKGKTQDPVSPLGDKVSEKSGLIGMRAGRVYDGEDLLWGMEFRDLAPSHDQKHLGDFLRAIQTRMLLGDYGLKESTAKKFLSNHKDIIDRIYYPSLLDIKLFSDEFTSVSYRLKENKNAAVAMLFHDWSKDPLFIEKPERLVQVEEARKLALAAIRRGENPNQALARFVKRSGLQYVVWESLRID